MEYHGPRLVIIITLVHFLYFGKGIYLSLGDQLLLYKTASLIHIRERSFYSHCCMLPLLRCRKL